MPTQGAHHHASSKTKDDSTPTSRPSSHTNEVHSQHRRPSSKTPKEGSDHHHHHSPSGKGRASSHSHTNSQFSVKIKDHFPTFCSPTNFNLTSEPAPPEKPSPDHSDSEDEFTAVPAVPEHLHERIILTAPDYRMPRGPVNAHHLKTILGDLKNDQRRRSVCVFATLKDR